MALLHAAGVKGLFTCFADTGGMRQAQHFHEETLPLFPAGDEDEAVCATPLTGRLPSYITDHRKRLRARFTETGGQGVVEYELLLLWLMDAHQQHRFVLPVWQFRHWVDWHLQQQVVQ